MKVIDLVKKMANGEPLPKKIKCEEIIWELDEDNRIGLQYVDTNKKEDDLWRFLLCYIDDFNDEVEVIEDNKIEKMIFDEDCTNEWDIKELYEKINEIIDILNKEN